jgi:uncharacterized protein YjbI with pentapeptide repeats
MQTLTYHFENLIPSEIGSESFQTFSDLTHKSRNFSNISISGHYISSCIFEDVIFENVTFWATKIEDCLFINCLFINCKFQFTEFTGCNFDSSSFDNCIWGVSKLHDNESFTNSELNGNLSFESNIPNDQTCSLNLSNFFLMTA